MCAAAVGEQVQTGDAADAEPAGTAVARIQAVGVDEASLAWVAAVARRGAAAVHVSLATVLHAIDADRREAPESLTVTRFAVAPLGASIADGAAVAGRETATVHVGLVAVEDQVVTGRRQAGESEDQVAGLGAAVAGSRAALVRRTTVAARAATVHARLVAVVHPVVAGRCHAEAVCADAGAAVCRARTRRQIVAAGAGTAAVHIGLVTVQHIVGTGRLRAAVCLRAVARVAVAPLGADSADGAAITGGRSAAVHVDLVAVVHPVVTGGRKAGEGEDQVAHSLAAVVGPLAALVRRATAAAGAAAVHARLVAVVHAIVAGRFHAEAACTDAGAAVSRTSARRQIVAAGTRTAAVDVDLVAVAHAVVAPDRCTLAAHRAVIRLTVAPLHTVIADGTAVAGGGATAVDVDLVAVTHAVVAGGCKAGEGEDEIAGRGAAIIAPFAALVRRTTAAAVAAAVHARLLAVVHAVVAGRCRAGTVHAHVGATVSRQRARRRIVAAFTGTTAVLVGLVAVVHPVATGDGPAHVVVRAVPRAAVPPFRADAFVGTTGARAAAVHVGLVAVQYLVIAGRWQADIVHGVTDARAAVATLFVGAAVSVVAAFTLRAAAVDACLLAVLDAVEAGGALAHEAPSPVIDTEIVRTIRIDEAGEPVQAGLAHYGAALDPDEGIDGSTTVDVRLVAVVCTVLAGHRGAITTVAEAGAAIPILEAAELVHATRALQSATVNVGLVAILDAVVTPRRETHAFLADELEVAVAVAVLGAAQALTAGRTTTTAVYVGLRSVLNAVSVELVRHPALPAVAVVRGAVARLVAELTALAGEAVGPATIDARFPAVPEEVRAAVRWPIVIVAAEQEQGRGQRYTGEQ